MFLLCFCLFPFFFHFLSIVTLFSIFLSFSFISLVFPSFLFFLFPLSLLINLSLVILRNVSLLQCLFFSFTSALLHYSKGFHTDSFLRIFLSSASFFFIASIFLLVQIFSFPVFPPFITTLFHHARHPSLCLTPHYIRGRDILVVFVLFFFFFTNPK